MKTLVMAAVLFATALTARAQVVIPHYVIVTWNWAQCTTATPPVCGSVAQGFNILRAPATGTVCPAVSAFNQVGTVAGIALFTYTDNSSATNLLTENATYCYIVQAYNQGGVADSPIASATIPFLVPEAPTAPAAVAK